MMTAPTAARSPVSTRVVLAAIWAIATAVNLTKAFHIDDTAYLLIAQWIGAHPLHPMSGTVFWGEVIEPISRINQPHLVFYLMAVWMRLFGTSEVAMHVLTSLFTLGGIVVFHDLSKRLLQRDSALPVALLFLGPAFLPSQNVMVDVPLLFFYLLFFWGLVRASAGESGARGILIAALAAAAAVLTKYSGLVLVPTLVWFIVRQRRWQTAWVLLIPILAIGAWSGFNYWDYGHIHLLDRLSSGTLARGMRRVPEWLMGLGAVAPLFALAGKRTFLGSRSLCLAAGVVSLLFGLQVGSMYLGISDHESVAIHRVNSVLALAFAANGLWLMLSACAGVLRARATGLTDVGAECLAVWLVGAAAFICLFSPFMAVRHVLLVLPPVILSLCAHQAKTGGRARVIAVLALSLAQGLALAASDWRLADVYRAEARALREAQGPSRRIWFTGHWGWQWYAEAEHMLPYQYEPGQSRLAVGDVIVEPVLVSHQEVTREDHWRLRHLQDVSIPTSNWTFVRTMSTMPYGGFYSVTAIGLAWKFSTQPLDAFTISEVVRAP
jgi:4-amino-4-deoxy-L-arabinose transferase-like glycosyltransferase